MNSPLTVSLLGALEKKLLVERSADVADLKSLAVSLLDADEHLASLTRGEGESCLTARATRFISLFGAILADPAVRLSDADFLLLIKLSSYVRSIALASGFRGTDHILRMLGTTDTESLMRLAVTDRQRFVKALVVLNIDTALPIEIDGVIASEPALGSLLYLSFASSKMVLTPQGHQRRLRLLGLADRVKPYLPKDLDYLVIASNAWMICSYADLREKHRIKKVLNRYLRDWLSQQGILDRSDLPACGRSDRPRMVVASEIMHSNHVQYRYFGQYLRQLRTKFELILVTPETEVDDYVRLLFDEVRSFKRGGDLNYLKDVRDLIVEANPEVIFWPSVGMRHWGTALANLRLAPMQFTALGHSASTFCDTIDYYLTEAGYIGDPALMSERLLLLPDESLRFERSPHLDASALPSQPKNHTGVVTVALPSNLLKMNREFLDVLKRIETQSVRPLSFKVFPNVRGAELAMTRTLLAETLSHVTVNPIMPYQAYMSELAGCDINLSPFPFGGLHSVVDSLRLGVPVVAMEGLEPHARTDAMLLRRLGMPEWLIAHSVDEYIEAALHLINDDNVREQLSKAATDLSIDTLMFGDGTTPLGSEVVDTVWKAYCNHKP